MSLQTLNDIFFAIATRNQSEFVLRKTDAGWVPVSSQQFAAKVAGVAREMRAWGIGPGDRIAILSENRYEWVVADFASLLLGAVVVPIYTSGTTGVPKGVMLTHGDMASNIDAFLSPFAFRMGMRCVSFLPLSHVTARSVDMGLLYRGVTLAHVPAVDQVAQSLLEVKPDILLSVPRVYEKVHAQVELRANAFS